MRNLEIKETALVNGGSDNTIKETPELPIGLIRIKKPFFPTLPIQPKPPGFPIIIPKYPCGNMHAGEM